jgi:hypothetical protein
MKKFLTLGVLVAALAATVGCEEKKSTGGTVKPTNTPAATTTTK